MPAKLPNEIRDLAISEFREVVCAKWGAVPYVHQREWWAASDGLVLLENVIDDKNGVLVRLPDRSIQRWMVSPREGGRARVIADLGAFKVGKSFGSALWATGFAAIPDARVSLIGLEYDICAPEFDYLCEFLLSEQGMGLKYDTLQNNPRAGRMWLDLENGARFEARSWERKDSLKGKEIDAYLYCEAYQLPGMECYTGFSQNLRARNGYAVFPTTPDEPWVNEFHDRAHSGDPRFAAWHCTCSVDASVNPETFDQGAKDRDRELMTREKFAIHYEGKLGKFVGRVFQYQRGRSHLIDPVVHPELFPNYQPGRDLRSQLVVPDGWEVSSGADTGTFYTGLTVAFSPAGDAFVLEEFPNYRYIAGQPERDEGITIPVWAASVTGRVSALGGRAAYWADKNTQFRKELANYGMNLLPSPLPLETRTEIAREYFQHGKIWLAPWLKILPFELENASWPEEATAAGKFARVKDRDHTLDCLEHVLSRRPRGRGITPKARPGRWVEGYFKSQPTPRRYPNAHLGRH
jgi:hypothetical protein